MRLTRASPGDGDGEEHRPPEKLGSRQEVWRRLKGLGEKKLGFSGNQMGDILSLTRFRIIWKKNQNKSCILHSIDPTLPQLIIQILDLLAKQNLLLTSFGIIQMRNRETNKKKIDYKQPQRNSIYAMGWNWDDHVSFAVRIEWHFFVNGFQFPNLCLALYTDLLFVLLCLIKAFIGLHWFQKCGPCACVGIWRPL